MAAGPILTAIGGRSRTVRLSPETAAKQSRHHPDLVPKDYARVQRILDEGELFRDGRSPRVAVGFLEEGNRLWRTAVKATRDGASTYLLTLHRAQPSALRRARERLKKIDQEEGE